MKFAVLIILTILSCSTNAYKFIVYYDDYIRDYDSENIETYGLFGMSIQRVCENGIYIERTSSLNGERDVYRKSEDGSHLECEILQENY